MYILRVLHKHAVRGSYSKAVHIFEIRLTHCDARISSHVLEGFKNYINSNFRWNNFGAYSTWLLDRIYIQDSFLTQNWTHTGQQLQDYSLDLILWLQRYG